MIVSGKSVHLHQECQIQSTRNAENILFIHFQFFFQDLQKSLVCILLDLQSDYFTPLTLLQLFLDLLEKIHCLLFLQHKVCISHNTERMGSDNIVI